MLKCHHSLSLADEPSVYATILPYTDIEFIYSIRNVASRLWLIKPWLWKSYPSRVLWTTLMTHRKRPPSLRMVASHTIIEQFLMRALLTVWWSFIRQCRDGKAVPHMLFQFDLVTHDLRSTRGVTRNWFGDARNNPVTTKASVNINRIRNEDRRFPTRLWCRMSRHDLQAYRS